MAQGGVHLQRESFCCPICLELLRDPVAIPCGHSYCKRCISSHWDGEDQRQIFSCPQCRQVFVPRPVLVRNTMLAELVEQLQKIELQAALVDLCYAGPEDVACDMCTGRKLKALKSCLRCLVSYCEKHLQPHHQVDQLKKHKLVEPSNKLQENICPHHNEVMKMFCRTDQKCICYLCSIDDHKGHHAVSVAAERKERQRELELSRQNIQQEVQDRQKDVKLLEQELEALNLSADEAVENGDKIFSELIHLMEERRLNVEQQIRSQQETEVSRVKGFQVQLQQEITELKRRDAELEQLSHTQDDNQFLEKYSGPVWLNRPIYFSPNSIHLLHFDRLKIALSDLKEELHELLTNEWTNISQTVTGVDVLLSRQPQTRNEFLEYFHWLTLDPNTVNKRLCLSEDKKSVRYMRADEPYPSHPDRCTSYLQVFSQESLTGRCYWEVEKGEGGVSVAVAYKDDDTVKQQFGCNDKSWSLGFYKQRYEFRHDNIKTSVSGPRSSRVGVYVDHSEGVLAFYSVSDTMTLLHRVQTSFTQPLYAALNVDGPVENSAELCVPD